MKTDTARIASPDGGSYPELFESETSEEAMANAQAKYGVEAVLSVEYFDIETPGGFI